jgi:nitrite reductase/ring-hydroxylating ferredoxin subunit
MNTPNKKIFCKRLFAHQLLLGLLCLYAGCTPDMSDDAIPYVPFSPIVLNLNLPEYIALKSDGGYKTLTSSTGGVQGIIVYRINASTFVAYERNCSYQPNNACATVEVDASGLFMTDPCCSSSFSFTSGTPTGGPAWRPLRQYRTSVINSDLSITDDIVE